MAWARLYKARPENVKPEPDMVQPNSMENFSFEFKNNE
jgi:hypothetical protein